MSSFDSESILLKFQDLLRIPTVSGTGPKGAYDDCATWLLAEMNDITGCTSTILPTSLPGKPIVVGSIPGSDPSLPAIYLNAHYDVVPVIPSDWTVNAWDAIRSHGKVYGRGAQDMKCVIIGYICALQQMSKQGLLPTRRDILLSFVPDEEIGGADGMCILLESEWFKSRAIRNTSTSANNHNSSSGGEYDGIAIAFDEGLASTDNDFSVFYGERLPWWIKIAAEGNTGHGSRFIEHTAVNALMHVVNMAMLYRESQRCKIHTHRRTLKDGTIIEEGCTHSRIASSASTLGDVTSLNVTLLRAGLTVGGRDVLNVIPTTAEAGFDVRISPHDDPGAVAAMLDEWVQQANAMLENDSNTALTGNEAKGVTKDGNKMGIRWYYENLCGQSHAVTPLDGSNKWWSLFSSTMREPAINAKCRTEVFPAATDSRFLRALGIKALGFSPMRNTKIMLHENDEYLEEQCVTEGVGIYVELITVMANADSSYDT